MKIAIYSTFGRFASTDFENYCKYHMDESKIKYYYKKDGYKTYMDVMRTFENRAEIEFVFG